MDENRFWRMIETAWNSSGDESDARACLAEGELTEDGAYALMASLEERVVPALRGELESLSAEDLLGFDRILERKLYERRSIGRTCLRDLSMKK